MLDLGRQEHRAIALASSSPTSPDFHLALKDTPRAFRVGDNRSIRCQISSAFPLWPRTRVNLVRQSITRTYLIPLMVDTPAQVQEVGRRLTWVVGAGRRERSRQMRQPLRRCTWPSGILWRTKISAFCFSLHRRRPREAIQHMLDMGKWLERHRPTCSYP